MRNKVEVKMTIELSRKITPDEIDNMQAQFYQDFPLGEVDTEDGTMIYAREMTFTQEVIGGN